MTRRQENMTHSNPQSQLYPHHKGTRGWTEYEAMKYASRVRPYLFTEGHVLFVGTGMEEHAHYAECLHDKLVENQDSIDTSVTAVERITPEGKFRKILDHSTQGIGMLRTYPELSFRYIDNKNTDYMKNEDGSMSRRDVVFFCQFNPSDKDMRKLYWDLTVAGVLVFGFMPETSMTSIKSKSISPDTFHIVKNESDFYIALDSLYESLG